MLCKYWSSPSVAHAGHSTEQSRMEGLCHSIQAYLDGRTLSSCAIDLVLAPHPNDKEYCINQGENWFEPGMIINEVSLTETFYQFNKT